MDGATAILSGLLSFLVIAGSLAAPVAHEKRTEAAPPALAVLTTDASPLPVGASTLPLPPATKVMLTLTLGVPNPAALEHFLAAVEDPTSPLYRHFLTSSEYVNAFAPPVTTAQRVVTTLQAEGAADVRVAPDRSSVSATVSAGAVEQLLGVRLVTVGTEGGMPLYTALGSPTLPSALAGVVSGVSGLSDRVGSQLLHPASTLAVAARPVPWDPRQFIYDPSSGADWFMGSDYAQAYGATDLLPGPHSVPNATYPTSVAVATLLASAYNYTTQQNLPPWDPAVIDAYFNGTLGPSWPAPKVTGVPVSVGNVTPPLPGSFGNLNDSTLFEAENSLDLEMAGSMAPGASIYNFYFAGSLLAGTTTLGDAADDLADDLAAALAYDYAPAHLATVSCSFGLPDLNDPLWSLELNEATAMGVTITSASGDQGNAPNSLTGRSDGQWPVWPATDATNSSGAVSVGGVSLSLSGTATSSFNGTSVNLSYDPSAGTISSTTAWWDTTSGPGGYAGSEGGASTVFPEPYWQFHSAAQPAIVNATVTQGASTLGRSGPDLALAANDTMVAVSAVPNGTVYVAILAGTSVAAPLLAGLLADVVAVENNRSSGAWTSLGFIDPEIYRFASYFAANPGAAGDPFSSVTAGHNYVFSAGPGWNAVTGWGGVDAPSFLAADRNSTLLDYDYHGPTPGLPVSPSSSSPVPWTYIYAVFGVGFLVAIVLVLFAYRSVRRPPAPAPGVPWGAQMGRPAIPPAPAPPGTYPGATFLCPYCGAVRPSEPVRCPQCGAF
jgi:subtilase family serine protease